MNATSPRTKNAYEVRATSNPRVGATASSVTSRLRFSHAMVASLLAVGLLFAGCGCSKDPGEEVEAPPPECETDLDCIEVHDERYYCDRTEGVCVRGQRYCDENGDVDCCPGQRCMHGVCLDSYESCSADDDCKVAGQLCLSRKVNDNEMTVCSFAVCEDGECPGELHCFAGYCIGTNPCRGGCAAGQACVISNNQCHPAPQCEQTCPSGSILVFADSMNVDDDCDMSRLDCACEALPPLTPRDTGRHSGIARLQDGTLAVSAYNGDYGDLVVVYFDADGNRLGADWVDGVPSGGNPVANPEGPRGGLVDPAENVGQFTSIVAAADGTLHVSYFDLDESRLKYARRSGGTWTTHVVDEHGDVGRYSSIILDPLDAPVISYFQRRGVDEERFVTALKLARANTPTPMSASDWTVSNVETATIMPPPCDGGCPSGEHCVDDGEAPNCYPAASDCDDCKDGQRCVDLGEGESACLDRVSTVVLEELPDGTGLFPAMTQSPDGRLILAYYDATTGTLKMAVHTNPQNTDPDVDAEFDITVVDGADDGEDVGRYPGISIDVNGHVGIVYQDALRSQVRWALVRQVGEVLRQGIVDDGLRDPAGDGPSRVGVDNSLVITPANRWIAVYQNTTAGELSMATRDGETWSRQVIASEGAAGFYADVAFGGGRAYVSHAVVQGRSSRPMTSSVHIEVVSP